MRWERWAPWTVAILLLVGAAGLVGSAAIAGTASCSTAVSVALPTASFVGEAVSKHGADVTFRVDHLAVDQVGTNGERAPYTGQQIVAPGETAVVHYRSGGQFVEAGHNYQVLAWGATADELSSFVRSAHPCPDLGTATVNADGTPINTGIFTLAYLRPYVPRVLGGLVILGIGALVIRRRIRAKHPKRTITGELVSR